MFTLGLHRNCYLDFCAIWRLNNDLSIIINYFFYSFKYTGIYRIRTHHRPWPFRRSRHKGRITEVTCLQIIWHPYRLSANLPLWATNDHNILDCRPAVPALTSSLECPTLPKNHSWIVYVPFSLSRLGWRGRRLGGRRCWRWFRGSLSSARPWAQLCHCYNAHLNTDFNNSPYPLFIFQ